MEIGSIETTFPALFGIVFSRYLIISGLLYFLFYRPPFSWGKRVSPEPLKKGQVKFEIFWSVLTSVFFAGAGVFILEGWKMGWIPVYFSVDERGWPYFFLSIFLMIFLHDTYFYWTHRWMHLPAIFRRVHRIHHWSRNPTPFASFSFHPLEALLEAAILPLLLFFIPAHPAAVLIFLLFMTVLGATNHLGFEIYPRGSANHWFAKWWIGPTHHTLHHLRIKGNYGLYFTFWDVALETEFPDYPEVFNSLENSRISREPYEKS